MRITHILDLETTDNSSHRIAGMILSAWLLLVVLTSLGNAYHTAPGQVPLALLLSLTIPLALFIAGYRLLPAFRAYVLNLDMRLLILLHSWRMLGLGFVMLYSRGQLPALFALPAGLGDAATAAVALWLGAALFKQPERVAPRWIRAWNSFGLADFIIAVSLGVLTRPGLVGHLPGAPGSDLMSDFPFTLVPAFIVPLLALSHIVIYLQLRETSYNREHR